MAATGIKYSCTSKAIQNIQRETNHLWAFAQDVGLDYKTNGQIYINDLWELLQSWYINNGTLEIVESDNGKKKKIWHDQPRRSDKNVKAPNQIYQRFAELFPKIKRIKNNDVREGLERKGKFYLSDIAITSDCVSNCISNCVSCVSTRRRAGYSASNCVSTRRRAGYSVSNCLSCFGGGAYNGFHREGNPDQTCQPLPRAGATSEHRIKELKLGIKADRLSCQSFRVNQFRLFLSQAAYILMLSLRKAAEGTKLATASVTRLRERIIKTAAKVTISVRRVLVELTAHCPFQKEISVIAQRLTSKSQPIFS